MLDYKENKFYIECDCTCGTLEISNTWDKEFVSFSYLITAFYSHQETIWDRIGKRLSIFWNVVIFGKEYRLYEILISESEKLQEFKNYVNSLEIKNDSQ